MGRYYEGDIDGKFWFGVQSSSDADYFGVEGSTPGFLDYNFEKDDLDKVAVGISECKRYLGKYEDKLDKFFFNDYRFPEGRGDLNIIKLKEKKINLIDESYNSNPLSLKSAILNYDKINSKNSKKYLLLGDMLELGNHSRKLHHSIVPIINQTKIDKVFVKGNNAQFIFKKLLKSKQGKILYNKSQIIELIRNDLNNNDYLMVKASNATGFNKIVRDLKGLN